MQLEHAPPNEKLYANPLLGVQATGNSNAIRGAWQPLRQAGATARTMLVAAAAKRWNVDPASCRARTRRGAPPADRTTARATASLPPMRPRMPVPENVALKEPKDFKLIGTPAKRLDTPAKVNGTAVYGIDARPPGVKIATLGAIAGVRRPREERGRYRGQGRQGRAPDRAARRRRRRRGRSHGRREERPRGAGDRMGRRPARQAHHRRRSLAELEQATLKPGAVAQNIGDVDKAMAERRHQGRGDLPGSVPRARDDGADELHGSCPQGRLRDLGRHPGASRASRRRPRRSPACRWTRSWSTII